MKPAAAWALALGLVATAAAWYATGRLSETPRTVIERFLDGLQEMNEEKILSTVHPAVRERERVKVEAMMQGLRELTRRGARLAVLDRRIQVESSSGAFCGADVSYTVAVEGGGQTQRQTFHERMLLFRDQGHWYRKINAL